MPKCNGGNWWDCADHIYNNCWFENCTIYDDNTGYLTYKGNWEKIPIFERISWIEFLISNLKISSYELVDSISLEKKEIVIKKLIKQLEYLDHQYKSYLLELQEVGIM